ncbi:PKD domain-containing protein [Rhodocytophaga aerolata]|uniref:PKD domain-containing protein n=1 Tax=Rhodocytophaga aerolata TaxID=455078 RepID=A0ABT8RD93_9BACT|nr:PKD domain-containing protein [Rhodocytophaga aerolata]MDO1450066.1 PKD domain-containing protein [Rhodocytophaga aerolata]
MTPFIKQFVTKLFSHKPFTVHVWWPSNASLHTILNKASVLLLTAIITLAACKKDDELKPAPEPQAKVTASAGADQTIKSGQVVALDGSASKDSKGTALSYAWIFTKKPAGSTTLLVNGTAAKASFTADVAGEYELELTVANIHGQAKDNVLITVTPPDLVALSGEITTDRILENINPDPTKPDYLVTDHLLLKAKLTVKPGVIIEFENDKGLHVFPQGTLVAKGTQAERIVFTGKTKTAGFWKGILLESNNELNELDFAAIEFAGSSSFMQLQADIRANLTLVSSTNAASSIKVANTLFAFSGGYGMYVQGMSELNGFSTNVFSKNTGSALYVPARQVHKLDAASVFTGNNGYNGVETSGIINHFTEVTWPDLTDNGSYYVTGDISVQSGLQLAQGVSLEFMQGLVMRVENNGYLYAAGELTNKITFTARTKTANLHWGGIVFNTAHEQNKLVFAEVSYAGNKEVDTYKANVVVGAGGNVSIQQSVLTNSLGWGIVAFTHQGALLNTDAGTSNTFSNMVQGNIKLTSVEVPAVTLAGEWLDDWSFKREYALDEKFYDRQANKWFRGAADPWTMNPHAGFGLKIKEDGSYIWTIAEYGPQAGCGNPYSAEYITGTVTQAANMLTFQESYWRSKFYNPCDTSQSVDLEVQPGGMTLRYEITQLHDAVTGQPFWQLKIFNPDNTSFNYYRH